MRFVEEVRTMTGILRSIACAGVRAFFSSNLADGGPRESEINFGEEFEQSLSAGAFYIVCEKMITGLFGFPRELAVGTHLCNYIFLGKI